MAKKEPIKQKVFTKEEMDEMPEGTVVWMEQNVSGASYIEALVSDGNGRFGNFGLGVICGKDEPKNVRYWRFKPTAQEMERVEWTI